MRLSVAALLTAVWVTVPQDRPSPSPPAPDPLHDLFAGRWEGTGTILGQPAGVELTVERVLDGRFTRLLWVSHIGPAGKSQRFEGHAYYRAIGGGRYRATWFDSSGMVRPIDATSTADALVGLWGTAQTEEGETTYRLASTNRLEVVDRVKGKDGTWREFGRSTLTRAR